MEIRQIPMVALRPGDIVAGHAGGWWVVTTVTRTGDEVSCEARNFNTGEPGRLNGYFEQPRDCAVEADAPKRCAHQRLGSVQIGWINGAFVKSARCLDCGADLSE
ncbi:hypothetical protein [Lentzea terrae]|uniref:hypothetical protein n=1 Tax=Lentzea terrae TaxID=2200761 RepID=UPI000DD408B9|nr:hypothetical protein [Lentzea terrae]